MKKQITALTLALLLMMVAGCGKQSNIEPSQADASNMSSSAESNDGNVLVAPPSSTGTSQSESEPSQDSAEENQGADPSKSPSEPIVPNTAQSSSQASESAVSPPPAGDEVPSMMLRISDGNHTVIFQLNDSKAAKDLSEQLPLSLLVEDYSTNEKIFYPPKTLDVGDAPKAGGQVGTLAYYFPWADVVLFFGSYSPNGGLYELGQAVSGSEQIRLLEGIITIEMES